MAQVYDTRFSLTPSRFLRVGSGYARLLNGKVCAHARNCWTAIIQLERGGGPVPVSSARVVWRCLSAKKSGMANAIPAIPFPPPLRVYEALGKEIIKTAFHEDVTVEFACGDLSDSAALGYCITHSLCKWVLSVDGEMEKEEIDILIDESQTSDSTGELLLD